MKLPAFVAAACLAATPVALRAHDGMAEAASPMHYGQSATLGTGTVRTYVLTDTKKDPATGRKAPMEIGIEIPWNTLYGLPSDGAVAMIDFPIQARDTIIQYMMLDWNPQGHEPAGIYDKPHFDFHFYAQDADEVAAIAPGNCSGLDCDMFKRAMKPVPAAMVAPGYMNVGSVVPYMGNHLIDVTSPEFHGTPFTRTFIYGAFDGQITFFEPMITWDSLSQKDEQCSAIKQPKQFATAGYYPQRYCTRFDAAASVYKVLLTDFTWRPAAPQTQIPQGN